MFNSWIVDVFTYFLAQLSPIGGQPIGAQLLTDYLGVWTPDLTSLAGGGSWAWLMTGTIGLGLVIGLWFTLPVVISAIASGDARTLAQAFGGLIAAAAAGPCALWFAAQVREPVIATAAGIISTAGLDGVLRAQTVDAGLFALLMTTLALIAYVLAGLIASYTYIFITLLAPIAAASLVMRAGVSTFGKWLSWFAALSLGPVWAALGLAVAIMMSAAAPTPVQPVAWAVGVILAALAPFTVLSLAARITIGGGADGSTKVGGGHTATSVLQTAAMRVTR